MISIEDFKSIVLDIVAAMAERVRVTEERAENRVPKCDVTKILFLENCNFGLKF